MRIYRLAADNRFSAALQVACNSAHDYAIGCFSVANAQEEIKLFTNSPDAQVVVVQGGQCLFSPSARVETDV